MDNKRKTVHQTEDEEELLIGGIKVNLFMQI